MSLFSVIGHITLVIAFLSCLFSFFLITVKGQNGIGNKLLALYLLVSTLELSVFLYSGFSFTSLVIDKLRDDLSFIRIPLFYCYILASIYSDFRFSVKLLFHFLPFLLISTLFIPRFYGVDEAQQISFASDFYNNSEVVLSSIALHAQEIVYITLAVFQLRKYKKALLEHHSEMLSFNYQWVRQLMIIWCFIFIIALLKSTLTLLHASALIIDSMQLLLIVSILLFICSIVLRGLYTPNIFKNINSDYQLSYNSIATSEKVVLDPEIEGQLNRLKKSMTEQELYLNPNLSIDDLADHLSLTPMRVSYLINRHLDTHFFDFVNQYRLEKAMRLLANPAQEKLTILEILYQVGFNSKSSFNSAFKKYTQVTPTAYRKQYK